MMFWIFLKLATFLLPLKKTRYSFFNALHFFIFFTFRTKWGHKIKSNKKQCKGFANLVAQAKKFNIFDQKTSLTLEYDQHSNFSKKVLFFMKTLKDNFF